MHTATATRMHAPDWCGYLDSCSVSDFRHVLHKQEGKEKKAKKEKKRKADAEAEPEAAEEPGPRMHSDREAGAVRGSPCSVLVRL